MSQRNPMNDRYTTDDRKGQTRKSAATMKPKSKAASSVRVEAPVKSKQQKKVAKKADRQKQTQVDRKYYNPPTAEYKKLRRLWWIMLVGAIVMTAFSWLARTWFPTNEIVSYVGLGLAYVLIIGALYVDFSKIRKVRRAYQEEMEGSKTKEVRAAEKKAKAEALAKAADPANKDGADAPKKRSLFGSGFRLSKAEAKPDAKNADKTADADGKSSEVKAKAADEVQDATK